MPTDTISLDFLARQQAQLLEEVKGARAESREVRRSFSLISDHFSRQERRFGELREDFETMLKLEIGGSIVNLETRLENEFESRLGGVEVRIANVEQRLDTIEGRLGALERVQAQLVGIVERMQTQMEHMQTQMEHMQAQMEHMQAQIEHMQTQMEHGQADTNGKLDAILAALRPA